MGLVLVSHQTNVNSSVASPWTDPMTLNTPSPASLPTILLVFLALYISPFPTGWAITWNGVSMQQMGLNATTATSSGAAIGLWKLNNPTIGAHNLSISWSGGASLEVAYHAQHWSGVDLTGATGSGFSGIDAWRWSQFSGDTISGDELEPLTVTRAGGVLCYGNCCHFSAVQSTASIPTAAGQIVNSLYNSTDTGVNSTRTNSFGYSNAQPAGSPNIGTHFPNTNTRNWIEEGATLFPLTGPVITSPYGGPLNPDNSLLTLDIGSTQDGSE